MHHTVLAQLTWRLPAWFIKAYIIWLVIDLRYLDVSLIFELSLCDKTVRVVLHPWYETMSLCIWQLVVSEHAFQIQMWVTWVALCWWLSCSDRLWVALHQEQWPCRFEPLFGIASEWSLTILIVLTIKIFVRRWVDSLTHPVTELVIVENTSRILSFEQLADLVQVDCLAKHTDQVLSSDLTVKVIV